MVIRKEPPCQDGRGPERKTSLGGRIDDTASCFPCFCSANRYFIRSLLSPSCRLRPHHICVYREFRPSLSAETFVKNTERIRKGKKQIKTKNNNIARESNTASRLLNSYNGESNTSRCPRHRVVVVRSSVRTVSVDDLSPT